MNQRAEGTKRELHTAQPRQKQDRSTKEEPEKGGGEAKQSRLTWLIPLVIIGALVLLYFVWPGYRNFISEAYGVITSGDRGELERWVSGFGAWGPLLIYALMIAQTLLAFIPSLVVTVVPVLAYGPLWGGLLAWSGLLLAACAAYGIGRALGPVTVERFIGQKTERKVESFVKQYGIWGVIAARVSPALSTDAVSFVAGLVRMGFWRFLTATAAGTLPLVALIAFLGRDFDNLRGGLIWVSLISLATFALFVVWDRRRKRGQGKDA